jgi:hypothetical protein
MNATKKFFRFDVDHGMEEVQLNNTTASALEQITSTTTDYLKESAAVVRQCAELLNVRSGAPTSSAFPR